MSIYIIVYDLGGPEDGPEYRKLIEAIEKRFPTHSHFQRSTWLVESYETANQICDALQPSVDSNDKIFVAPIGDPKWNRKQEDEDGQELRKVLPQLRPKIYDVI